MYYIDLFINNYHFLKILFLLELILSNIWEEDLLDLNPPSDPLDYLRLLYCPDRRS